MKPLQNCTLCGKDELQRKIGFHHSIAARSGRRLPYQDWIKAKEVSVEGFLSRGKLRDVKLRWMKHVAKEGRQMCREEVERD